MKQGGQLETNLNNNDLWQNKDEDIQNVQMEAIFIVTLNFKSSNLLVNQIIMECKSDLFQTRKNSIDLALEKAAQPFEVEKSA